MKEKYDILFKKFGFKEVRNKIFDELIYEIKNFTNNNGQNDNDFNLNNLTSKFEEYKQIKKTKIIFYEFIFDSCSNQLYFYHQNYENYTFKISKLKKFQVSSNNDASDAKDEWIFDNHYLMYLVSEVYKMENPKFAHSLESINDENSIISLKENNINTFMKNDWKGIYDAPESIDYDEIEKIKQKSFKERINEPFFIELIGLKNTKTLPEEYIKSKSYCSSFEYFFSDSNYLIKKNILFHNEDIYFRFNLFQELEYYYNWGNYGNLYINFELLKNCKRHQKLSRFVYFLSFLFPRNYNKFSTLFEDKIKHILSDKLESWPLIINEIITYFEKNIFKISEQQNNNKTSEKIEDLNDITRLFNNVQEKKFLIIFDNILTKEENDIVEKIINNYSGSNFIFIIIHPLINGFTFNQLIKYINEPNDTFSPFYLFFTNLLDFNSKSPKYFEEKNSKIFEENVTNDEIILYDLIRIFNFKSIFVDSFNNTINSKSIDFLARYLKHLNIQFDNENKKIIDIAFKNENIEKEYNNIYENTLTYIKTKNSFSFNNIMGQRDGYDLERIIINKIIIGKKESFEVLNLKSIFGLKDIEKKNNVNYEKINFILKQRSLGGEMFDFGFKIIKDNKQYLKIAQVTSDKTKEEKEKISIERINLNCSYLKKKFKENNLGELDGISICILAPLTILKDKKKYKKLKIFSRENNYEFILFDLNSCSFFERIKGESYKKDLFEIDNKYMLNLIDFNELIKIDKPLNLLSSRKVQNIEENMEDLDVMKEADKYMGKKIKRIAKFEYKGNFSDLKKLNENYFGYIYLQKTKFIYFFKDKIIKMNISKEIKNDKDKDKRLIFILYSVMRNPNQYVDSSNEEEIEKNKKKKKKKNIKEKSEIQTIQKSKEIKEEAIELDEDKQKLKNEGDKQEHKKKRRIFVTANSFLNKKKESDK